MAHVIVTPDSSRVEIEEAVRHLREKQRRCVIPSTANEVGAEIDALLEAWAIATP